MTIRTVTALMVLGALSFGATAAQAGPCTNQIAQFEHAVRPVGTTSRVAPQPVDAKVGGADLTAQGAFRTVLAEAEALDAQGDRVGCTEALSRAKQMYDLE